MSLETGGGDIAGDADTGEVALKGLLRLAFGGISDAVKLSYLEEAPSCSELSKMDLFCVSEIKRPKSGGCEMRFYDRLKALEILLNCARQESAKDPGGFLEALRKSASEGEPNQDEV